jgi:hypothetical protein
MDTSDAGIVLNQAVALMLLNEADAAEARARLGIEKAGGVGQASSLLGLRSSDEDVESRGADRSAEKPHIAKNELAALLSAARQSVPVDTGQEATKVQPSQEKPAARSVRSAGTRASGESVVADMIYWKH